MVAPYNITSVWLLSSPQIWKSALLLVPSSVAVDVHGTLTCVLPPGSVAGAEVILLLYLGDKVQLVCVHTVFVVPSALPPALSAPVLFIQMPSLWISG